MNKVERALFAGVAAVVVAFASDTIMHSARTVIAETSDDKQQNTASIRNIHKKAEALGDKVDNLLQLSEDTVVEYQNIYEQLYSTDLRLSYRHITYSSRLVQNDDYYIKDNPTVNTYREQPIYLDLRTPSSVTAYELDQYILKETALEGLGAAFVQAELDHGVNALFLLSLGVHESNWGRSDIARDKNNLFGFGAYDKSPYASAVSFATKHQGINHVAKYLSDTYLSEDGKHYCGGFTLKDINKKYSTDEKWSTKIANTMDIFNKRIMNNQDTDYHLEQFMVGENENGESIYSHAFSAVAR